MVAFLAPLIGGAIGAIGSAVAGNKAAKAQTSAANDQIGLAREFRTDDIARFAPYSQAGQNALSRAQGQLGSSYETSPYANALLTQGRDAIESGAAARGGLFSGQTLAALDDHRTGVVAADRDNYLARNMQLANMGQSAAGLQANISQNAGQQIGNALSSRGNALAANATNQNNSFQNLLGQGFQSYGYMKGPFYGA